MKNLFFKSTDADLQKMFQSIETIQKNVLYMTYRIDTILKCVSEDRHDKKLQTQVDEYFEKDPFGSAFSESVKQNDTSS